MSGLKFAEDAARQLECPPKTPLKCPIIEHVLDADRRE
jgi:hypothetical protein